LTVQTSTDDCGLFLAVYRNRNNDEKKNHVKKKLKIIDRLHIDVSGSEAEKSSQTDDENIF